jgi:hypothetical protein
MGDLAVPEAYSFAMELITCPKSPLYATAMHEIMEHFNIFDGLYDHITTTTQTLRIRDKTTAANVASLEALAERFGPDAYSWEFRKKWGMALLRARGGRPSKDDVAFIMQIGEVFGGKRATPLPSEYSYVQQDV